jgi:hypothetical protein
LEVFGAVEFGRKVACAVAAEAPALPLLTVERIAGRAAVGEFWRVLAKPLETRKTSSWRYTCLLPPHRYLHISRYTVPPKGVK